MFVLLFSFAVGFVALYLFTRLTCRITRSSTCLIGKTAIVTGANSGLGYQTTLNLASRGCRVIMADVADMEQSKLNVIKYTGNNNIVTKKVDLTSLKSIRSFAAEILKTEERLDILMNNAGVGATPDEWTDDGLHPFMQINYFSHFLLTHLLIDLLKKSAPSRIVFTSSLLAFTNNLTAENLNFDATKCNRSGIYRQWNVYGNSKVALTMASDIFAEKLTGTGVTSNCVHPGLVATKIFEKPIDLDGSIFSTSLIKFSIAFFAKDPWEGSQGLVHAAVSKRLEKVSGKFFCDCIPFLKPRAARNRKLCLKIWSMSEELVGLKPEERL